VELRASNASRAFLMDSFQTVEKIARRRDKPHIEDINNKIVKFYFDTDAHIHTAEYYAAHIGQSDSEVTDTDSRYFSFDCKPVLFTTNGCVCICCEFVLVLLPSFPLPSFVIRATVRPRPPPSPTAPHRTAPLGTVPPRHSRVGSFWGRVSGVDHLLRLVHISFCDKQTVTLFQQHIPFDHPQLEWFAMPDDDFSHDAVVDMIEVEEVKPTSAELSEEEARMQRSTRVIQRYVRGR
jgi:hypothetical protein